MWDYSALINTVCTCSAQTLEGGRVPEKKKRKMKTAKPWPPPVFPI